VTIARKILLVFCVVLMVVAGVGLWTLHSTRRLHHLNQQLLLRAIPATRIESQLAELVPVLERHETRAVLLRDAGYEALHETASREFARRLSELGGLVDEPDVRASLREVQARFARYAALVEREWQALRRQGLAQARELSAGPTRAATDDLAAGLETLRRQTDAALVRRVAAAGHLEQWTWGIAVAAVAGSLAIGLGLTVVAVRQIVRPIQALSRATREIAGGQFEIPLAATQRDEVGELARAFRDMARQLQRLEAVKSALLANITHDLRSPLTSIGAAATLLDRGTLGDKERRWLAIIQADSAKILRLSNQILDLEKLRAGALTLSRAPHTLQALVDDATQELGPEIEERGLSLSIRLPEEPVTLLCDGPRVQQVLTNLLSNAAKFTRKGGEIVVTGAQDRREAVITVRDSGIGIPRAELPHLFSRYHQAHGGKGGGTGLGLAIVKEFVEAHGGRVWADSEEGEGAAFHVALPLAA